MKHLVRAVIILGFLVGLITLLMLALALFGPADDRAGSKTASARCDLLKDGPCVWNTDAGRWSANLEMVRDTSEGTAYRLQVITPETPQRFLAVLRGESMYMGEYPVALGQDTGNPYTAQFTAPICSVDASMTWRIDLQEGQAPIEDVPLTLVFEAAGG
ncbi:hypothetical protein SAMN04488073_0357 [Marinobacter gudaonensis]|uniref:Uncharacterized protein n=1 Tax=Marinobacter gudaonensis TaxID=375760 RepID=A0A1I6GAZ6_9GAMM|nr:hypothetical protein [Marinobacter gudaonensis]SFR39339.1 hypothetical protein SAMN04488073_0357 [Marinobacter gudaonensis]